MKLKEKFKKADKESESMEDMANRCIAITDEVMLDFITWLHSGQTYALKREEILKIFKEDYEKGNY